MRPVKRVEFTITRAEVWPWIITIWSAIWCGGRRVKLTLTGKQDFVIDPDKPHTRLMEMDTIWHD